MKDETLGQIFRRYRESEGLKIEKIEKDLKISHRMIEALEADDYRALPDELYVKNIIKTYARYLSLDYNRLLTLYDAAKTKPDDNNKKSKPVREIITPQRIRSLIIFFIVLILFSYLGWQLNQIYKAPDFIIYEPTGNLVITQNFIIIKGKTEKEARVYINEKEIFLDSNGEFSATLDLQKGLNLIKLTATKKRSAENTVYREILVQ